MFDAHTLLQDELPSYPLGLPSRLKVALGRRLDRSLPRMADHIVSVTGRIEQRLLEEANLPRTAVTTIENGIDPSENRAAAAARQTARFETGDGSRRPTLVFANLAPYQGIDLLLEAFARVGRRHPDLRLLIVSGDSFSPYRSAAVKLGVLDRIEVVNAEVSDLFEILAGAQVAANPRPLAPGVPVKLLNYMLAGLPVVSFAGSTGGLLRHAETGWLVPGSDVAAFADGVLKLLDNPTEARKLGESARRHALALGSWTEKAREMERVYARVLADTRGCRP